MLISRPVLRRAMPDKSPRIPSIFRGEMRVSPLPPPPPRREDSKKETVFLVTRESATPPPVEPEPSRKAQGDYMKFFSPFALSLALSRRTPFSVIVQSTPVFPSIL